MRIMPHDKPIGSIKGGAITLADCDKRAKKVAKAREKRELWQEVCKRHGVNYQTYCVRVCRGWDRTEAATTPARQKRVSAGDSWRQICKRNGINYNTFLARCNRGWDKVKASTTAAKKGSWAAKCKAHGVLYTTYSSRVRAGWDRELAATIPALSPQEAGKRSRLKS